MGRIATIISCKLLEQKNEIAAKPLSLLLWLPRLAVDVAAAVLAYRWLSTTDLAWSALVFCAVPAFYFLISLLTVFQKLFADRQLALLLTAPLDMRQIFTYKYMESSLFGAEIAIVIGLPLSFAIGHATSASAGAVAFFSLALNLLMAASLATVAVLLFARYITGRRIITLLSIFSLMLALVGSIIWFAYHGIDPLSRFLASIETLWRYPGWLIMIAAQSAVLTLATAAGLSLMTRSYHTCRSRLSQGQRSERKKREGKAVSINLFTRSYSGSTAIFIKDMLMSLRSPMQLFRAVLTLALLPLYLVVEQALRGSPIEFALAMNIAFVSGLVFIFIGEAVINAFSSEVNRIRILLVAPIRPMAIVRAKFLVSLAPVLIVCVIGAMAVGLISSLPAWAIITSAAVTTVTAAGFTAVLVGMGAINSKPDKESSNLIDQLMSEQVMINSPAAFAVFIVGTIVLAIDLAIVFAPFILSIYKLATTAVIAVGLASVLLVINGGAIILSFKIGSSYLERLPASRG